MLRNADNDVFKASRSGQRRSITVTTRNDPAYACAPHRVPGLAACATSSGTPSIGVRNGVMAPSARGFGLLGTKLSARTAMPARNSVWARCVTPTIPVTVGSIMLRGRLYSYSSSAKVVVTARIPNHVVARNSVEITRRRRYLGRQGRRRCQGRS